LVGAGSPFNTVAWAEAYLHTKWHLNPSSRLATIDMGRKFGGGEAVPLFGVSTLAGSSPSNTVSPGPRPTSVPSDPSSHLATTDVGQKLGAVPLFGLGELGPRLTQSRLG